MLNIQERIQQMNFPTSSRLLKEEIGKPINYEVRARRILNEAREFLDEVRRHSVQKDNNLHLELEKQHEKLIRLANEIIQLSGFARNFPADGRASFIRADGQQKLDQLQETVRKKPNSYSEIYTQLDAFDVSLRASGFFH